MDQQDKSDNEFWAFKQKAENDFDDIHAEMYNLKRDITKFKSTADL